MINELSHNPIFFLRYFPPKPSRVSHTLIPIRLFVDMVTN